MQLIFNDQYLNALLLLNGLVILFYYGAEIKAKKRAMKFGNFETLQKVTEGRLIKSGDIPLLLRLLGFSIIIIGISGPVLVQEIPSTESSYLLAIDSSTSMTASDIEPTRFEAAKEISTNFIDGLPSETEIGLVMYSGNIEKQLEVKKDKPLITNSIRNSTIGSTAGTATGDAIISGSTLLAQTEKQRQMILITDGKTNVGTDINESIEFAKKRNVTVNTIGLGSNQNATSESINIDGLEGESASFPNLEEENLFRISNSTDGDLSIVSTRDDFETAFSQINTEEVERDISTELIFLGLLLLISEWVFSLTKLRVLP